MRNLKILDNGNIIGKYEDKMLGGINRFYSFDEGYVDIVGNTTLTGGSIRYFPIRIYRPVTIDSALMNCSTALASGTFRIGIYDSNFNRVIDMGEQPLGTTGQKPFNFTNINIDEGQYWVAVAPSGNTGFSGAVNRGSMFNVLGVNTWNVNCDMSLIEPFVYANMVNGELPLVGNPTGRDSRYLITLFRVTAFL
jgi:hypothetical protein